MSVLRELVRVPDAASDQDSDPVEVAAHAAHTAWARADRWDEITTDGRPKVPDTIKAQWRAEARAVIAALSRAGFMRGVR